MASFLADGLDNEYNWGAGSKEQEYVGSGTYWKPVQHHNGGVLVALAWRDGGRRWSRLGRVLIRIPYYQY